MLIVWNNQQWMCETVTTGQWWSWAYEVSCRAMRRDPEWVAAAVQWCARVLGVSVEDLSGVLVEIGPDKIIHLGNAIVAASSMPDSMKIGMRRLYDVTYECEDYDPTKAKGGPCECPECRGGDVSELCKFRHPDIGDDARAIGTIRTDIVAQFWSLPLPLYQQEIIKLGAVSRRELSQEQQAEARKRRKDTRDQILSSHGIH